MMNTEQRHPDAGATPGSSARTIPGYTLLDCLDSNSLEDVFRVRHLETGRPGILKILAPGLLPETGMRDTFLSESRAVAALRHDALLPVLDIGFHNDRPYYVTEWQSGKTALDQLRELGRLKESNALLLIEGVALGLQYGWDQARVFHGHLTPESIRISDQGLVRLADLGLTRALSSYAGGGAGRGEGLPFAHSASHYASPEQAAGDAHLDFRTDIYSLGAVLYHLLTGVRPFDAESDTGALVAQATRRLPDPQTLRPDLSPGAAWLIEKMMQRDRDRRPASWSEVLADIDEVELGGTPFGEKPAPGNSVIERCPSRETQMARLAPRKQAPVRNPKIRVVLPNGAAPRLRETRRPASPGVPLGWALVVVAVAMGAVGYIYFSFIRETPPPWTPASDATPSVARAPTPSSSRATPPVSRPEPARPAEPTISRSQVRMSEMPVDVGAAPDAPSLEPVASRVNVPAFQRHRLFVQAARDFNLALALFKRYESDPSQASDLSRVEQLSEQAAANFQELKSLFPKDLAVIDRYLDQAYGMARYARQSMLMAGGSVSRFETASTTVESRRPNVMPWKRNPDLDLAPDWRAPVKHDGVSSEEMRELLINRGRPHVDLSPKPSVTLLNGIAYLMPIEEVAANVLRRPVPEPEPLQYSAYPFNSLKVYTFNGTFEERFDRLRVITDREGKTVAIRMSSEKEAAELWLPDMMFNSTWKVLSFLDGTRAPDEKVRVAHRVRSSGGVVRIETEAAMPDETGALTRSLSRSAMILPQPIVDLMVLRLSATW